jgi:hypothetical protein
MNSHTLKDDPSDRFSAISDPVEYKDAPITFTLHEVRGRQEEIKIVEPELDYPLPEDDRLIVTEKDVCLTDVVFKFNPASDRPYELHFSVHEKVRYAKEHVLRYGTDKTADKDLTEVYKENLVDQSGVKAWIEMKRGKARLFVKYKNEFKQIR